MDKWEFSDRHSLEKYTREYISTYFDTQVIDGDVVPKAYKFGKISKLSEKELYEMLTYYRNKINSKPKPKAQIHTIKEYYDSGKLKVHHTFDRRNSDDTMFWIIFFAIIIILLFIYYRRK
jgi:DNA helicase TIP49 (TBP-interacting protein)